MAKCELECSKLSRLHMAKCQLECCELIAELICKPSLSILGTDPHAVLKAFLQLISASQVSCGSWGFEQRSSNASKSDAKAALRCRPSLQCTRTEFPPRTVRTLKLSACLRRSSGPLGNCPLNLLMGRCPKTVRVNKPCIFGRNRRRAQRQENIRTLGADTVQFILRNAYLGNERQEFSKQAFRCMNWSMSAPSDLMFSCC